MYCEKLIGRLIKKMNKSFLKRFSIYAALFIFGSLLGFIHENLLTILKGQPQLRQGLIYEPLIPIYGLGLVLYYLAYTKIKPTSNKISVFLVAFFIGGLFEYGCSYVQEKLFGTISWDYSYLLFNFNGRTSLFHAFCWGMAGVAFYELIPHLQHKIQLLEISWIRRLVLCLSLFVVCDCMISTMACYRQEKRRMMIAPKNGIEVFLDEHYPDERLDSIFNNAQVVK